MNIYRSRILVYFLVTLTISTLFELAVITLKLSDNGLAIISGFLLLSSLIITVESRRLGLPLSAQKLFSHVGLILSVTVFTTMAVLMTASFFMHRSGIPDDMQKYFPSAFDFVHGLFPSAWALGMTTALHNRWVRSRPFGPTNDNDRWFIDATAAGLASIIVFWVCMFLTDTWPGAGLPVMYLAAVAVFVGIVLISRIKRQVAMVPTENGVTTSSPERREIDFNDCRYLFVEAVNHYCSGMYMHTSYTLTFTDHSLDTVTSELFQYNTKDDEDTGIQHLADQIIERWHEHILPRYQEELEQKGRLIFPSRRSERQFIELTHGHISLSSISDGCRIQRDEIATCFWHKGSLHISDGQRSMDIQRAEFADVDLLPELMGYPGGIDKELLDKLEACMRSFKE
ncbi:hypothetical protein FY034_13330 [Trichlorobacter lovleyi]|uniref:hypothetical protein n=1 Tax=Trichlorobacter lovleyi TaxID=313985 RepID=UPI00223FC7A4|nr:hypothetical protein [Trichlorobacter lovleyi]QOX79872.1 hypothetical protein FY034_13330 [Trichlorobacter lovleyi]